jgi:nucleoside-diphosphate-sugar epimerase
MKTAFVTGANGFIGSHLVVRLLELNYRVIALGRGEMGGATWSERVIPSVLEAGGSRNRLSQLHCSEFHFETPQWPMARTDYHHSPAETILFHVAGDTRFSPSDPDDQRRINVDAPLKLVEVFKDQVNAFVHISTAFVSGTRTGLVRESHLDCGQSFHNAYEKSKFDAEVLLTKYCRTHSVPLVIVRPSIITNDRKTGRASTFTHLNALVEVINRIQKHHELADGEVVSSKIRLMADPLARPNLAPIDSIIPPLVSIAESPDAPGRTFHLCHPNPQTNEELVGLICEAFKVNDKVVLEFLEEIARPLSHTEEMILRSLKPYSPYLNSRCDFDLSETRSILPDYHSHFSPINESYVQRIIEFQRQQGESRL